MRRRIVVGLIVVAGAALLMWNTGSEIHAQATVAIDPDDIGGVVTGPRGPEAGVWVIAETDDFRTLYRKIVVTDDQGRYVLPDLPTAEYTVWVRGYGLVDSEKVVARPGRQLALKAVQAPDRVAAAQYYPASYWLAMVRIPGEKEFPQGTVQSQAQLVSQLKNLARFQVGDKATRELPPKLRSMGFKTTIEALRYYTTAGQLTEMNGSPATLPLLADWVDRVAAGEVPDAPPRPTGVERNVVVTLWDVSNDTSFIHDIGSTDKWNPTVNVYGRVYGAEFHHDQLVSIDPLENTSSAMLIPTTDERSTLGTFTRQSMENPSLTWGNQIMVSDYVSPDTPMFDHHGRVWVSGKVARPESQPAFCADGNRNRYAKYYPFPRGGRATAVYDTKTGKFLPVPLCFGTHHVTSDKGDRMYFNGLGNGVLGWIDTEVWAAGDSEKAQGWCGPYLDINGDGRITPTVDRLVEPAGMYSVNVSPVDGSVWGASPGTPGRFFHYTLGANPPETCVMEVFEVPFSPTPSSASGPSGFTPRGMDVDSQGVAWSGLAGSGHIVSFDRRLCKAPMSGETAATGRHCPEGWKLYPTPGPRFQGADSHLTGDYHYYAWVDRYNTSGLGADTPLVNGTNSDSLIALDRRTWNPIVLRVPYPLGFYQRGMDGRIDDPNAGWKGRGLWSGNGTRAIWHTEKGVGSRAQIAKFQVRPTPLAK